MHTPSTMAKLLLALAIGLPVPGAAEEETAAEALKRKIQERTENIKEFGTLLDDPDQSVRLGALDAILQSDDVAMREMVYASCFSNADLAMRAICLKYKFADIKAVVLTIDSPKSLTTQQQKALNSWGGTYSFRIKTYDEKTGQFTTVGTKRIGSGQISGSTLTFSQQYCNGALRLVDGGTLEGEFGCNGGWNGKYTGQMSLQ